MNNYYEMEDDLYNSMEGIEKITNEKLALKQRIEEFFKSQIGQYITKRIEDESNLAIQKLIVCDPTDTIAITQYQNDVRVVNSINNWLVDALDEGYSIEAALKQL